MPAARWRDIADDLRARIERGEWQPGEQLPSQRELMRRYSTRSPATINRAIGALVAEGLLRSNPTAPSKGMQVRDRNLIRRALVRGLRDEHAAAMAGHLMDGGIFEATTGVDVTFRATYRHNVTDPGEATILGLDPDTLLLLRTFRWTTTHDGEPFQLAWSWLAETTAAAAGMRDETAEIEGRGTMHQLLDAGITVDRTEIELGARIPTAAETVELDIPPGVPVVVQRQVSYAADVAVVTMLGVVPGDRVAHTLTIDYTREDSP